MLFYRKQKGFSLVETMIVVAMLLIVVAALTPTITTYYAQNRLKGAAEGLYDNVMLARSSAVKSSTSTTITFVTGSSWCYGISSGAIACACGSAASASNCNLGITSSSNYPNTSLAITSGFAGNAITFDASRGVPNTNGIGTITLSSTTGSTSITATVNAMGETQICSTTVGGYGC